MATKFGVADDVGDTYPCAKFHFGGWGGSGDAVEKSPLHRSRSILKWPRFAQGCAFWGPENKIFLSTPYQQNENFWPIFDETKFRVKMP